MINLALLTEPLRDLRRLARLEDGWHFGTGVGPSASATMNATALTLAVASDRISKFEYFPEESGGILIIAYCDDESAEILATSNGGYELAFEDAQGLSPAKILASIEEVQAELEHRGWRLAKSLGSFTRFITVSERADTPQWHFVPAPRGAVFPSSTQTALGGEAIRAAPTRRNITIDRSEAPPQFSGVSELRNLLQAAS